MVLRGRMDNTNPHDSPLFLISRAYDELTESKGWLPRSLLCAHNSDGFVLYDDILVVGAADFKF